MAALTGILIAIGGAIGGSTGAVVMFVISLGLNFYTYWNSDTMCLRAYNARVITREEAPNLYDLVERLAERAQLPMPRVAIIEADEPNAFATGRNPEHAAVAVTTGIMRALTYEELAGVISHELAHLLGVSSEAEANFWAYQVCIHTTDSNIRYSGYFGLLPYVIVNTRSLLSESEFTGWFSTIRPEIIQQLYDKQAYWDIRYNDLLGKLQDLVYNWYLKSNQISSGQKNYAQVIGMVLSLPESWW